MVEAVKKQFVNLKTFTSAVALRGVLLSGKGF